MSPADFSDLTPPEPLLKRWAQDFAGLTHAARWGAHRGYTIGKQEWPDPITDRPPTKADGDEERQVQYSPKGRAWGIGDWDIVAGHGWPWLHCLGWQPKPPSLREQALADVEALLSSNRIVLRDDVRHALESARRALQGEEAGE